jgi:phage portal protein BeeE
MTPLSRLQLRVTAAYKAFVNPYGSQKSFGGYSEYYGQTDLTTGSAAMWSKWGAASAVLVSEAMYRCVIKRAETVVGTGYRVVDKVTRKPVDAKQDPLMRALMAYQRHYGQSFFQEWMYDRDITGEVYIEPLREEWSGRVLGLDMLSSLNVTPWSSDGINIDYFQYTAGMTTLRIPVDMLVYDRSTVARLSPIHGYSPALVAIGSNSVGVMQAAGKAMLAYFNNDGATGTYVMPSPDKSPKPEFSVQEAEFMRRLMQPVKHASGKHGTMILPYRSEVMTVAQPDLMKWAELLKTVGPAIYTAFGMPASIAGDADSTRFLSGPNDKINYDDGMVSLMDDIAATVNHALAPLIYDDPEPSVEFEFETEDLEHIDPEERLAARDAYQDGTITLNEYRTVMGYEPIEQGNVYLKRVGTEYVTAEDFIAPPEPVVVQTPPPPVQVEAPAEPRRLPANVPDHKAIDEFDAYVSRVRSGKAQKRAFTWYVIDGDMGEAIESEVASADAPAVKSVLDTWRAALFAKDGITDYATKAFDDLPAPTREYIKSLVSLGYSEETASVAGASHYAGVIAGKRTTGTTKVRFDSAFRQLLQRAGAEKIGKSVFIRNMSILLDRYCRQAFVDGFGDGGVYGYEPEDDDERWIFAHVDKQASFIENFASKLYADDALTESEINEKPDLWFNGSVLPAYNEGLMRASKDGAGKWFQGPTSDRCVDCSRMNGKVYRFSTFRKALGGTLPPCPATECGGFQCKCEVVPSREPVTKGRPPMMSGARKHSHEEAHQHVAV